MTVLALKTPLIPVVIFAYARPDHLRRTLEALRYQNIPEIWFFCDGAKGLNDARRVAQVGEIVKSVNWTETHVVWRKKNLGLAKSICLGLSEVLKKREGCIALEDDLVCSQDAYSFLVSTMVHYRNHPRFMSVSGWTHSMLVPPDVDSFYFDGRADSLCLGVWSESWMWDHEINSLERYQELRSRGEYPEKYGFDIKRMVFEDGIRDIWAVRFLLHHMRHNGLCLRPCVSLVEHIGYDESATNTPTAHRAGSQVALRAPPLPTVWPPVAEDALNELVWRKFAEGNIIKRVVNRLLREGLVKFHKDNSFYYLSKSQLIRKVLGF